MTWMLKTLADDPANPLSPAARRAPRVTSVPGPNGPVAVTVTPPAAPDDHMARCPVCGGLTAPDMLVDVRGFVAALLAACGWAGCAFACDGCRETAHRTGVLTHEQLVAAQGAPAAMIVLARAHDVRLAELFPRNVL